MKWLAHVHVHTWSKKNLSAAVLRLRINIKSLIQRRERIAYQEGIVNAHKHDMLSAKACLEANKEQLSNILTTNQGQQ